MIQIKLPRTLVTTGQVLNGIASDLNLMAQPTKTIDNGYVVYEFPDQSLIEDILDHDAVILIASSGGDIFGYIMYAELPYQISDTSIYECIVPEGLADRIAKVCTGTQISLIPKNLSQWCNNHCRQSFSTNYQKIYLLNNPLTSIMSASEMKLFVDGFSAKLLTRGEFGAIGTVTE